ncbi:MAG TPA: hypothetical protein GXZ57_06885 [Acholeplasmataceae bacterium]|nr:hypothetical protein [Acholeplasmataceae bacterium]
MIDVANRLELTEKAIELDDIVLGDEININAGSNPDYDPADDGYGLKQLLQIMNYSKVFTLGKAEGGYTGIYQVLNDFFFGGDEPIIDTTKPLGEVDDNNVAWDTEIEVLIDLLATVKLLGLMEGDMAEKVLDLDWTDIEDVLGNMNNSTIIRVVLPDLINNALVTAGMDEWASVWLTDQTGANSALGKEVWAEEITLLAKLINVANGLGLTDGSDIELDTIELGNTEVKHAGNDATYDPTTDTVGLKQLLQIMNYSKVFTLGKAEGGYTGIYQVLDDFFFGGDEPIIKATKPLGVVVVDGFASIEEAWDTEIDALVVLVKEVQDNGLTTGDLADALTDLTWTATAGVLDALNGSTIVRSVLPDLVYNALESAGMEERAGEWLIDQKGATGVVAPFAEWKAEIPRLAKLISIAIELGLDATSMDLETMSLGKDVLVHAGTSAVYNPDVHGFGLK